MAPVKLVLIDNYDSFTWNIYEYLCREGADVSVFRNDKITIPEIEQLGPDLILISPGPGTPENDSGISRDVIKHFMGKLPIFGVCMGLQCIVSLLGGKVEYAGEIVHGKTSHIMHNNTGCFYGVSQGVSGTRYHSLAASIESLPDCLEVTARTENSGVIQGVRHKGFILEGVQFHPESILSEEGRKMFRNFLSYKGGKWSDFKQPDYNLESESRTFKQNSILTTIYEKRKQDVFAQQEVLGQSLNDIEQSLKLGIAPKVIDFKQRLSQGKLALIAEVKRASPSKGPIALDIHAPTQALQYADAGASAISVLTEPKWFKGTLDDLIQIRRALDKIENRPAVLRKEFIFSNYQIAEARLAGADSVLLIVKMLTDFELSSLYEYSVSLGMEPLVEVSNADELKRALHIKAKIIGVNNRNLHSFEVDMSTTSNLVSQVGEDILLIALSGINEPQQVSEYAKQGVKGILVGESLMRASNPKEFANQLINA